jgi:fatty-acyl-CoA synthase
VRLLNDPPTTGTNKIVKRTLVHQKWRSDRVGDDPVFVRGRNETTYRRFTPDDERDLHQSFRDHGRERFWDL